MADLRYRAWMKRSDDCMRAAIATCLQTPMREVPDAHLDARLKAGETIKDIERDFSRRLHEWAFQRGLVVVVHDQVPADRDRWVGVIPAQRMYETAIRRGTRMGDDWMTGASVSQTDRVAVHWMGAVAVRRAAKEAGPSASHCLVLDHGKVLHDPLIDPSNHEPSTVRFLRAALTVDDVAWGLSFDTKDGR